MVDAILQQPAFPATRASRNHPAGSPLFQGARGLESALQMRDDKFSPENLTYSHRWFMSRGIGTLFQVLSSYIPLYELFLQNQQIVSHSGFTEGCLAPLVQLINALNMPSKSRRCR